MFRPDIKCVTCHPFTELPVTKGNTLHEIVWCFGTNTTFSGKGTQVDGKNRSVVVLFSEMFTICRGQSARKVKRMQNIPFVRRHSKTIGKRRRGAAMVEMAVCFPVFMLILLGIMEFGRALMVSQMLTNAAREGCRSAVIEGATNSDVESRIDDVVTMTVGISASDVTKTITVTDRVSGAEDTSATAVEDADPRDLIFVEITVAADTVSYTPGRFLSGGMLPDGARSFSV
jgi:Flp pilus assembly protein TadG